MQTIVIDGNEYGLGCHERKVDVGAVRPCLESAVPLIEQDKWEPCDFSHLVPEIGSQGSHSSCVGHQCTDALMTVRAIEYQPPVRLSPWKLYSLVAGGRDGGAQIADAIKALHAQGTCTLPTCPDFTLSEAKPAGWDSEAKRFKLLESFDAPDRKSIASAVQRRYPTPLGIAIYANFERLESIGGKLCVPKPAGKLRGYHCVLACGLDYLGGIWRVKLATKSWPGFGDAGCAWYAVDWIDNRFADGWAMRSVTFSDQ